MDEKRIYAAAVISLIDEHVHEWTDGFNYYPALLLRNADMDEHYYRYLAECEYGLHPFLTRLLLIAAEKLNLMPLYDKGAGYGEEYFRIHGLNYRETLSWLSRTAEHETTTRKSLLGYSTKIITSNGFDLSNTSDFMRKAGYATQWAECHGYEMLDTVLEAADCYWMKHIIVQQLLEKGW